MRSERSAMRTNSTLIVEQVRVLPRAEDQVLWQSAMSLLRKEKSPMHFCGQWAKEAVFGDVSDFRAGNGSVLRE